MSDLQETAGFDPEAQLAGSAPTDEAAQPTGNPAESDQPQPGEEEGSPPAGDNAGAPRSKGAERRIRQLTRKYREAERENQQLRGRLDQIEERLGPVPEPERPRREAFDTTEDYEDALFDWRDKKLQSADTPPSGERPAGQPATQELAPEARQVIDDFEDSLEDVAPDAVDLVMNGDWKCSPGMTQYIMSSENSAQLAYHLASNPDIAEKISKMSPSQAARELVKVDDTLQASSGTDTGAHSTAAGAAPPPLSPSKATGATGSGGLSDKMSTDQWVAERRRQMEERARQT